LDRFAFSAGITAAALVCFAMAGFRPQLRSDGDLMLSAILRLGLPLTANAAAVWIICLMRNRLAAFQSTLAASTVSAAWLAPLALWLGQASAWAVAPAGVLAATLAMRLNWTGVRGFGGAFTASALLQAGVIVLIVESRGFGTLLIALAAAVVTLLADRRKKRARETTPFRALLAAVIALSLTLTSLMHYLEGRGAGGASAGVNIPSKKSSTRSGKDGDGGEFIGGSHRGIILWPDEEPVTKLVPPLPSSIPNLMNAARKDPLSVPFYGVYWFFRDPHKEPPPGSYRLRGAPDVKTFRSADYIPLQMEARQNFGILIDVNCCSRIELAIRNADHKTRQELELLLMNTSLPSKPSVSLGRTPVSSRAPWQPGIPQPVPEVLSFAIPQHLPIARFDEVAVRFHRTLGRHASSRMAIEKFTFVPRGR